MKAFKQRVNVDGTDYSVGMVNNLPALCITTFLQDDEGKELEIETRSLTIIPPVLLSILKNWETDVKGHLKNILKQLEKARKTVDQSELLDLVNFERTLDVKCAIKYMNGTTTSNKYANLTKDWQFVVSDYYGLLQNKFYFVRMLDTYAQIRILCFSKAKHEGAALLYDIKTLVVPKDLFIENEKEEKEEEN